jgi:CxxC motif-containing protein (DUF1111 family)
MRMERGSLRLVLPAIVALMAANPLVAWAKPESMAADLAPTAGVLAHHETNRDAFAQPAPSLDRDQLRIFNFGNRLFNTNWVAAPASVDVLDGLGPTFNRVSCSGCHLRDGRGRPPINGEVQLLSMLIRWSVPGRGLHGEPRPVPGYGGQLNDRAIVGIAPEARLQIRWVESTHSYPDGESYSLRAPRFSFHKPAYGPLPESMQVSARVAPAVIGMGLIGALDEASILANADPYDRDGDGVSGKANWVYDPQLRRSALGRFGWKAGVSSLMVQNASAASGDIGLTSSLFPQENCPTRQHLCRQQSSGGEPELSDAFLSKLTQYLQFLGVPARRASADAGVAHGDALFTQFGCAACHRPEFTTPADVEPPLLANQTFRPYSDFLLHDLGKGLADDRAEFRANGREWRTAPLWGVGLFPVVNDHQFLLHDGRARGVAEAILWHGGEASRARQAFANATRADRERLVAFVNSL